MKNNNQPLISIVILNYNQLEVTCEFLESTKHLDYKNYEIIVIDNNSRVDPTERITQGNYHNTSVMVSDINLGFTGGNNMGIQHAKGEFVFIVNNDTEVTHDLLDKLLAPFKDPTVGVVCPKILFYQQPDLIQYAGFRKMNHLTGRTLAVGSREIDKGQYASGETYGAHGAAMLVRMEVIDKVGAFADDFFIYYEEWDWSARIRKAGYKIYFESGAKIFHKESITMGKESAVKAYFHTRNRILYMRRNTNFFQMLIFSFFLAFFVVPKAIIKYIFNQQKVHMISFFRGILWHFNSTKYTLKF
jgi:GT2 family glycosyltransferase